ncbi:sporulation integral membrane protein YtvI [Limnochorda pilosa]|uniref:Sporulation kinase n=1 Tax=Limnochorda pilosa TaxID=1555112 RepID=A0A0K2SNF0_LIMPI|nr:sporulation integral membrane protein YtvI [Limnochorda pilosa]BAS28354.1 sporulation kinase [Limnochorda pilosa]
MAVRPIWIVALVVGAWYVFGARLIVALAPFVLAAVASAVLHPLVRRLSGGLRLPRPLAVLLSLTLVLLVMGGLTAGLALLVAAQVNDALQSFPLYQEILQQQLDRLLAWVNHWYVLLPPTVIELARENTQSVLGALESAFFSAGQALLGLVTAVPVILGVLAVALIATYFVSRDWDLVKAAVLRLIPRRHRQLLREVPARLWADALRYVRAQLVLIAITTGVSMAGLLVIGVNQWLVLGLVGGMLDVLPVLGPGLLYVPWGLYALLTGEVGLGAGVVVLYLVASGVRQMVEARVVGESLGVHPLLTLAGLYLSATLFGLAGFLLAPLLIVLGKAAWESGLIPWFSRVAASAEGGEPPTGVPPAGGGAG